MRVGCEHSMRQHRREGDQITMWVTRSVGLVRRSSSWSLRHGIPFSWAHLSTRSSAASAATLVSTGSWMLKPFALAHSRTSILPRCAAVVRSHDCRASVNAGSLTQRAHAHSSTFTLECATAADRIWLRAPSDSVTPCSANSHSIGVMSPPAAACEHRHRPLCQLSSGQGRKVRGAGQWSAHVATSN